MGVVLFASLSPRMMAWSLCEECPTFENWQQGNCKLPDKYSLCNPCTNLYIAWSPRVYDLTPCSLCLVRYCTAAWHSCRSKFFPLFSVCLQLHHVDRSTLSDSRGLKGIKCHKIIRSISAWMCLIPWPAWQALLAALSRHQRLQTAELLSMQLRSALIQHGEAENGEMGRAVTTSSTNTMEIDGKNMNAVTIIASLWFIVLLCKYIHSIYVYIIIYIQYIYNIQCTYIILYIYASPCTVQMWISATAPHARMLQGGAVERTLPEKIGNSRRPVGWRTWHESRELHILIRSFETFWNCVHLCPSVSYVDYVVLHWMFWLCEVNLCSVLRFDFVEVWPSHLGPFAPLTSFQYLLTSFNIKSIDFYMVTLYTHIDISLTFDKKWCIFFIGDFFCCRGAMLQGATELGPNSPSAIGVALEQCPRFVSRTQSKDPDTSRYCISWYIHIDIDSHECMIHHSIQLNDDKDTFVILCIYSICLLILLCYIMLHYATL